MPWQEKDQKWAAFGNEVWGSFSGKFARVRGEVFTRFNGPRRNQQLPKLNGMLLAINLPGTQTYSDLIFDFFFFFLIHFGRFTVMQDGTHYPGSEGQLECFRLWGSTQNTQSFDMFWLVLRFANLCKHFGRCRYKSQSQMRRRVPRCHAFDIFRPFLPFLSDLLHLTQEADWAAFERCLTQNHYGCDSHFILISEQLTTLNTSRCCLTAGTVHFKSHSGKIRAFAEILNPIANGPAQCFGTYSYCTNHCLHDSADRSLALSSVPPDPQKNSTLRQHGSVPILGDLWSKMSAFDDLLKEDKWWDWWVMWQTWTSATSEIGSHHPSCQDDALGGSAGAVELGQGQKGCAMMCVYI